MDEKVAFSGLCLIADDSSDLRHVLKTQLNDLGFQVIDAENGRSALALMATHSPDYLFVDISMPEMDGLELLSRMEQQFPDKLSKMKCFIITGRCQWEQDALTPKPSMKHIVGWLRKPFDDSDIVAAIAKVNTSTSSR